MIGPPLPYNVHTNVHAVFHGIPAPPLDLLRFPAGFPPSKDFENFRSRDSCSQNGVPSLRKISLPIDRVIATKRKKVETYIVEFPPNGYVFFFLFLFRFQQTQLSRFRGTSRQDVTNRVCAEVSKRFLRPYLPTLGSRHGLRRREQPCHG